MAQKTALSPSALPGRVYAFLAKTNANPSGVLQVTGSLTLLASERVTGTLTSVAVHQITGTLTSVSAHQVTGTLTLLERG